MSRISVLAKSTLVSAVATVVALILAELVLRLAAPDFIRPPAAKGFFEYKSDGRALGLVPNYAGNQTTKEFATILRTNEIGLRDPRSLDELARAPGLRIMCMGDSFTFGWGVDWDKSWCQRLGGQLREGRGIKNSAVSTGFDDGLSPVQYEFHLDAYLARLRPDLVVVGLFMENDVKDAGLIETYDATAPKQRLRGLAVVDGHLVTEAGASRSRLYFLAYRDLYLVRLGVRVAATVAAPFQGKRQTAFNQEDKTPYFLLSGAPRADDVNYAETLGALVRMNERLSARGIRFAVMMIPSNFQVSTHYFAPMTENYGFSPVTLAAAHQRGQPQAHLAEYFSRHGVAAIDLLPELRRLDRPGNRMYFDMDAHFSVKGNDEAARIVAEALERLGLLADRPGALK